MLEDISKKTVVILLVLTIIISVAGTLIVLEEAQKIRVGSGQSVSNIESSEPSPQVGMIRVNIQKPPELQGGAG